MRVDAVAIRQPGGLATAQIRVALRGLAAAVALAVAAMFAAQPISWGDRQQLLSSKTDPGLVRAAATNPSSTLSVIVREAVPASSQAEDLVRSLGGTVTRELGIVGGFGATVPARQLGALASSPIIWRVWGNATLHSEGAYGISKFDGNAANSVWKADIKLNPAQNSYLGTGVGVALIDTGVVPTRGLQGRVSALVDFTPEHDGMDRFGHGTHLAGLMVGDPAGATNALYGGVAPKANLVSVKVAGYNGATDVSTVIAGLQWVVAHKADYNIRVVNLSFGTDSKQPYSVDPLDYAVERTWFSGIVVVVSAGNVGPGAGTITKPGDDPYVITVGGGNLQQTVNVSDDVVPDFSAVGPTQDGLSKPDIVGPAISLLSDADPGSTIYQQHSAAVVGEYFKGSGTSQATAVVTGVVALMLQANPSLSPDVVKATLKGTANKDITTAPSNGAVVLGAGAGFVDANSATGAAAQGAYVTKPANQGLTPSTGTGSLEASRGSLHVYADTNGDGVAELITGETDVIGEVWTANGWGANGWGAAGWAATAWANFGWLANGWGASGWGANGWGGMAWDSAAWAANGWGSAAWGATAWG